MYDLSSKFNSFYSCDVVLPQDDQTDLYNKKDLNVSRLKDGLKEYNAENNTSYAITEICVQGSVAMSTVVQNEDKDYDIDVAIVFNKSALGDKGAWATRNIVANALERKTKQFNTKPEVKTSCVRVKYADGYHIDFAVYRRERDDDEEEWHYEHSGADWSDRELRGLTDWFTTQNDNSDGKLRKVVRLSKMFCKSRDSWKNMPSGLLQTVLCDECLASSYDRIDEMFYYTMQNIVDRLEKDTSVSAPVDDGRDLTPRKSDITKMTNWKNRLKSKLEDLDVLFDDECTQDDAMQAWYGFFNHEFWSAQQKAVYKSSVYELVNKSKVRSFYDSEEFIEDKYPVHLQYVCQISCNVSGDGWRPRPLIEFRKLFRKFIPHNLSVTCKLTYTDCPQPYEVLWKVKNNGPEAERKNDIRGQIVNRGNSIEEKTNFYGNHYIECYIVKDNVCVARTRVDVPIRR